MVDPARINDHPSNRLVLDVEYKSVATQLGAIASPNGRKLLYEIAGLYVPIEPVFTMEVPAPAVSPHAIPPTVTLFCCS